MILFIKTIKDPKGYHPHSEFKCPYCGVIITFYSLAPKNCPNCNILMEHKVGDIKKNIKCREEYYRYVDDSTA